MPRTQPKRPLVFQKGKSKKIQGEASDVIKLATIQYIFVTLQLAILGYLGHLYGPEILQLGKHLIASIH